MSQTEISKQEDREQARERVGSMRFLGGMLIMAALLLYFFHLAEQPMGRSLIGVLAGFLGGIGAALLFVGQRKLRNLR